MFGRKKTEDDSATQASVTKEGGKGRPTPKRKEAEAARKRPLVPADRKTAAIESRARERELRAKQQAALSSGDESALPMRDKGPVRRFARDFIDTRRSMTIVLYPGLLIALALTFVGQKNTGLAVPSLIFMWALILFIIGSCFFTSRALKKALKARFGDDVDLKGVGFYGVMRSTQARRLRLPKPQVEIGGTPRR